MQPLTAMTNTIPYDTTRDTLLPDCLPHTSTQCSLRYPDVTKHPYDFASFLLPGSCMPSYSPTLNFEIISID